jgi:hypothetical protein
MSRLEQPHELRAFDEDALEADQGSLCAIREDGTILWFNEGWVGFAEANGGADVPARYGVGASYFDAISGALRQFYEGVVHDCVERKEPFEQEYECPSPELRRVFRLRVMPVRGVLLIAHSLVVEEPHAAAVEPPLDAPYRAATGIMTMCSNCRRTRRADQSRWDWVPAWVSALPAQVSHGICPVCVSYYYGDIRLGRSRR